jgi:ABC-2 type transport system ATP-binding protein
MNEEPRTEKAQAVLDLPFSVLHSWFVQLVYPVILAKTIIPRARVPGGSLVAENAGDLVVETYKLTKIYKNRQIALNDVTLKIEPGCVLGLLGQNGAGKTTLLRLILGLHRPTAGWAKVWGRTMGPNSAALRCRIGYIPTNPQFPRGMTPIGYLDYMARLFGLPADVRKPRLASLIRAVDLLHVSGDPVDSFSNGMTARLAVATSLINEPELLIWDEPTHGLDPEARRSMLELIKTLAREKTLIVSSHNLSDIDEVCNHAAVLSRGHMIYFGSLQDLKGRMRKNHYELDLEGDQKAIAKAMQTIKGLSEFKSVALRQRRLELRLSEEASNASALANVFMTLADNKVTLISIRSVGQQTEQAFLDLVEKEEARGFSRAYQNPAEAA